ncbi:MAG: sporulation integral membrane protein YtvI [Ruminococcaceae bacterium]|nr:sporulation integral membrane protein YtvI [Oscillospiraceae bacterium]
MYRQQKIFLVRTAYIAVWLALFYLAVRYLLLWLLPFLIALGLAALAEPAIDFCRRKMRFRRSFTAAVLTLTLLGALSAAVWLLLEQLLGQAVELLTTLPGQLTALPELLEELEVRFNTFCAACPAAVRVWLEQLLDSLSVQLPAVLQSFSARCLSFVTEALGKLPQAFLFCATTALAVFFTAGSYPAIMAFFRRQLSGEALDTARGVKANLFTTLGKWLRSELTLIAITFMQLLLGFLLLRQPYALLLSVLIALIDALPVFGTGTVLLPWTVLSCITGQVPRGIALAALYASISLVRSIMEPKIMAAQAGLPPLAALGAMYVGFCTLGVAGMVLFPILLLFTKQLHDAGLIRLWK